MIRAVLALLPPRSSGRIATHLALTLLSVVLRALSAVLLVPLVAALFSSQPAEAWPWTGWLVAAVVGGWAVDWLVARIAFGLGFEVLQRGQRDLAEQVNRIRLTWFDGENTATARQSIAAIGPELVGLFVYLATPMLAAILLPVAIAIALMPISLLLGLAALAGVPVLLGAFWLAGRLSRAADRAADEANTALTERVLEFARTQQALRSARRVGPERSHVGAALDAQHGATMRLLAMQVPGQLVFSLASQLALMLLAGVTVWLSVRGTIGAPEAVALIAVIARYLEPFTALAGIAAGMEGSLAMLRRVRTVLDAPTVPAGTTTVAAGGIAPPRIELRGVQFSYGEGAAPVLDGLNLVFEPGSTTAIVGPSGSGKSTILTLIAGLHQPDSGTVEIAGIDAAQLDADARRALSTFVFQQPYLFDTSVRENLLVGDPGADEERVAIAAALARVDGIVDRLPDSWDSRVGEAGSALSGGERQRVSIARALLKPAPVLLVDEATSALDTENEAAVAAALSGDPIPRTRVIVAHRLSSIRAADCIVFIDDGRVVEQGSYEELLRAGGRFAEFHAQQHAATGWRIES
ncbi:ABC transporter ATP-binding protein [Leucobacter tenebrionis]|uniref:ABC transporter ATP-binding protein n=1 Tax=Leucobacter tenebrionis TaxID=2873270 RepID=UPI001CA6AFAE|nr:ABC transporter ATP-binding protein [Leucobacter tenebrionis]QZY51782.1 ABC transporter ATP-binding protein/permease [Leucobacter tenebrionis]